MEYAVEVNRSVKMDPGMRLASRRCALPRCRFVMGNDSAFSLCLGETMRAAARIIDMTVATDYARAVAFLDRTRLPAYVSFVEQASARGLSRDSDGPQRIYVRIADGKIVSGIPPANVHVVKTNNGDSGDPFRKPEFFEPHCYAPQSEDETRWNGQPAVRFELRSTCNDDSGFTELYADPQTLRPIAADGTMTDADSHMTVALELRYTTIGEYTVPASIRAHAVGHGWLFWARERVEVDYTGYQFYQTGEFMRRQAAKPNSG